MAVISLENLTKHYGDVIANENVTFDVEAGEIFGYLGPNGAGKTTTIRQLLGLIKPTSGTAYVLGADIRDRKALTEAKHNLGYLPDHLGFEERLTGNQVLNYFARMRGDERRDEMLELFHPPLERPVEEYSSGNRRMLGIVQAFMHDPDLIIMDEPTAGLDPLKQDRLHLFLEQEVADGKTIFFSSHILSEVQRVCDRVGIIRNAEIVEIEDIESLLGQSGKDVWIHFSDKSDKGNFITDEMIDIEEANGAVRFTYTGDTNELIDHLGAFDLIDVSIGDPQLDDIFKHYYGDNPATEQT